MTLKEKVAEVEPTSLDELFKGGVFGCPNVYKFLNDNKRINVNCIHPGNEECTECWNREYIASQK